MPVTNGYRKLRRVLNPNGFTTRVMTDVRRGAKDLITGKPQSLADYFAIGSYYVAKKLVFIIAVLALVLPILYLKFLHPVIRSSFLTASMVVNKAPKWWATPARWSSSPRSDRLRASTGAPCPRGRITGEGTLVRLPGNLIYQGGFLMEQYEGTGQSFWPNGKLQYSGGFSGGQYEGSGTLYTEDGVLLYEGSFANGLYEGQGTLYQNGSVLYPGRISRPARCPARAPSTPATW